MPVPSTMADLTTVAATNNPPGTETVGTLADDYHRALQSIVRRQSAKGADIPSASTLTPGADGNYFTVTGTTTITAIAGSWVGRRITLLFASAVTIAHSSNLLLAGSSPINAVTGDVLEFIQDNATPIWRCISVSGVGGITPVLLARNVFTSPLSSITFLSQFSPAFSHYHFKWRLNGPTDAGGVVARFSIDGSTFISTGGFYNAINLRGAQDSSTPNTNINLGGNSITVGGGIANGFAGTGEAVLYPEPQANIRYNSFAFNGTLHEYRTGGGRLESLSQVNGIEFSRSGTQPFPLGRIEMYGYRS